MKTTDSQGREIDVESVALPAVYLEAGERLMAEKSELPMLQILTREEAEKETHWFIWHRMMMAEASDSARVWREFDAWRTRTYGPGVEGVILWWVTEHLGAITTTVEITAETLRRIERSGK